MGIGSWSARDKDTSTRQFISTALQPAELEEFDNLKFGKVPWLQRVFESKILSSAQGIVSGQRFGTESLEQAHTLSGSQRKLKLRTVEPGRFTRPAPPRLTVPSADAR